MDEEERAILKQILMYLKIARRTDHVTYEYLMHHPVFSENLAKLEKLCGWNAVDEAVARDHAKIFTDQTKGKTLKEKGNKMSSMAWKFGKILAIAAAGYGVAKGVDALHSPKKKTPPEEEGQK